MIQLSHKNKKLKYTHKAVINYMQNNCSLCFPKYLCKSQGLDRIGKLFLKGLAN